MKNFITSGLKTVLSSYPKWLCHKEYRAQTFSRFNERPVEFSFVFKVIAERYPRTVLDVGSGTTALPHLIRNCGCLVTAIDNVRDYWPTGMYNRHYHVIDDDITDTQLTSKFDLVTCISVLEHIKESSAAVGNMISLLDTNGLLILTFPYSESSYVRNVYELPNSAYGRNAPYITQSYSRANLDAWCKDFGATIIEQEYYQFWTGSHWTVGDQIIPPARVNANSLHQHSCILLKKSDR